MPFTDCVLLWSDGDCRREFTTHVFKLLSELALEVSSLVINQPSRHAKGSNLVFEEVIRLLGTMVANVQRFSDATFRLSPSNEAG